MVRPSQRFLLAIVVHLVTATATGGHEMRPAIATIGFETRSRLSVVLTANLEALIAGIGAGHDDTAQSPNAAEYDRLRALAPDDLHAAAQQFAPRLLAGIELAADGTDVDLAIAGIEVPETGDTEIARVSTITLVAEIADAPERLRWCFDPAFGDCIFRLRRAGAEEIVYAVFLGAGVAEDIALTDARPPAAGEIFVSYLTIGFQHIIPKGLDHILFVVGLFLLSPRLAPLFWQVTSFTLAHSVTLALSMLGVVSLPPSIVEPLIAASILYVGVENIVIGRLTRWRPAVVFGFGLLHGLGFAGVLNDVGLAPAYFLTGLLAFNLGVEAGQIAVILACFIAVGFWFGSRPWYRNRISIPASAAIAAIGLFWLVERMS